MDDDSGSRPYAMGRAVAQAVLVLCLLTVTFAALGSRPAAAQSPIRDCSVVAPESFNDQATFLEKNSLVTDPSNGKIRQDVETTYTPYNEGRLQPRNNASILSCSYAPRPTGSGKCIFSNHEVSCFGMNRGVTFTYSLQLAEQTHEGQRILDVNGMGGRDTSDRFWTVELNYANVKDLWILVDKVPLTNPATQLSLIQSDGLLHWEQAQSAGFSAFARFRYSGAVPPLLRIFLPLVRR